MSPNSFPGTLNEKSQDQRLVYSLIKVNVH